MYSVMQPFATFWLHGSGDYVGQLHGVLPHQSLRSYDAFVPQYLRDVNNVVPLSMQLDSHGAPGAIRTAAFQACVGVQSGD